jgi:hypothetical protein
VVVVKLVKGQQHSYMDQFSSVRSRCDQEEVCAVDIEERVAIQKARVSSVVESRAHPDGLGPSYVNDTVVQRREWDWRGLAGGCSRQWGNERYIP